MGDGATKQKERFSRAWIVAAAAAANFTYEIVADDERGVDMTVHDFENSLDFQLKATSHPLVQNDHLIHDLDVRTYDLLRSPLRAALGVLALVVISSETGNWHSMDDSGTRLDRAAYYLALRGMPATSNATTVRLRIPMTNLLTAPAMRELMSDQAARWRI